MLLPYFFMVHLVGADEWQESLGDDKVEGKGVNDASLKDAILRKEIGVDRLLDLQESVPSCGATRGRCSACDFLDIGGADAFEGDTQVVKQSILFESDIDVAVDLVKSGVRVDIVGFTVQDDIDFVPLAQADCGGNC